MRTWILITLGSYMASSLRGQDDPNPALWLASRADKMALFFPLGTTLCVPREKFLRKPQNKSFIGQACSIKLNIGLVHLISTPFRSRNTQRKNLAEIQRSWPHTWSITHITYPLISILFPLSRLKCIRHSWGSKLQPILGEVVVLLRPSSPEPRAWSICAVLAC